MAITFRQPSFTECPLCNIELHFLFDGKKRVTRKRGNFNCANINLSLNVYFQAEFFAVFAIFIRRDVACAVVVVGKCNYIRHTVKNLDECVCAPHPHHRGNEREKTLSKWDNSRPQWHDMYLLGERKLFRHATNPYLPWFSRLSTPIDTTSRKTH